jgi:hypothetical protein
MTVRSFLNQDAKNWWYHAELRRQGQIREARRREHQSIRDNVKTLRLAIKNGGFITLGRGGWTLHISSGHTHSGYGCDDSGMVKAAIHLGLHGWDSRVIPDERIYETVGLPMAVPDKCVSANPDYMPEAFRFYPFAHVAPMYAALGAKVW